MGVFGIRAVTFLHSVIVCISVIVLLSNTIISMGLQHLPKASFFNHPVVPSFEFCTHLVGITLQ